MEQKHSGLGIASFITSVVAGVGTLVLIAVGGVMEFSTPGGMDEDSREVLVLGLLILAMLFTDLVALGLGIAGLAERGRKGLLAVLGIVFSAATIVGVVALMVLGEIDY